MKRPFPDQRPYHFFRLGSLENKVALRLGAWFIFAACADTHFKESNRHFLPDSRKHATRVFVGSNNGYISSHGMGA
jgi:hypothetical protein